MSIAFELVVRQEADLAQRKNPVSHAVETKKPHIRSNNFQKFSYCWQQTDNRHETMRQCALGI